MSSCRHLKLHCSLISAWTSCLYSELNVKHCSIHVMHVLSARCRGSCADSRRSCRSIKLHTSELYVTWHRVNIDQVWGHQGIITLHQTSMTDDVHVCSSSTVCSHSLMACIRQHA